MEGDDLEEIMRQLRRGAPFGWLLALLLPLLVSGGPGGAAATALLRHPVVATIAAEHQPLSRQVSAGGRQHDLASAPAGTSAGAGGGHPVAAPPQDARHPSPGTGLGTRPARDDDPRPLSALRAGAARAPPSTGG